MRAILRGAVAMVLVVATSWLTTASAGAVPAGDGCNASGVPAALISWYPANPGGASALKMSCTWNNNTGTAQVSASFTLHDHNMSLWHNGAARTVTTSGSTLAGSLTVQLSTASNGIAGLPVAPTQMNRVITGTGLSPRTHVKSMTAAGLATLSKPVLAGGIGTGVALKLENASARSVDDATSGAPDLLNSTQANFTSADIGLSVSGTGVPANTTISAINSATQAQLSASYTLTGSTVSIGSTLVTSATRQITGASTTSAVRINSSAAGWLASDIGLKVAGVCDQGTTGTGDDYTVPANVYILATPSGANADTTGGLTAGQTGCNLTVGEPSATAPTNGDTAAHMGVQADLNPTLIAGAGECSAEQPEGFVTIAKWFNPGSFQGIGITSLQPGTAGAFQPAFPTKAIGQLFFDTAVGDASAFVIEKKALSSTPTGAADPIGVAHYDVLFPFLPTTLGMCPGTGTSPGLGLSFTAFASTAGQASLPTGTGRPGTLQLRSTLPASSGGYTSTAYVMSDHASIVFTPASAFNRLCLYPAGLPNAVSFQCGPG
jgi:hypothetical protein